MNPPALALTVALHLAVLVPVSCSLPPAPPPPEPPVPVRLPRDAEFQKHAGDGLTPCDPSYTGIGIRSIEGFVYEVAPLGPAARVGVLAGDTIENHEVLGYNRHGVGTPLTLFIMRNGQRRVVALRVERICQESPR